MKIKKCMALAAAVIFSVNAAGVAWAGELEDQLADIQEKASRQQAITDEANARVSDLSSQLGVLEDQVREASDAYYAVKSELDYTQEKIDENQELLERTEEELQEKNQMLNRRVHDIYINGQVNYVDVVFGAKDFSDFMTRMDMLKRLIKHDYDLVSEVKEKKAIVKTAREELEADKVNIERLVEDADAKLSDLEDLRYAKEDLLAEAEADRDASEAAYNEFMAASEEIAALIRQSQMSPYAYTGSAGAGGMVWPLAGPVTSEYGWRTHPIFGTSRFHSGIDIGGDYGQPIVAASSGTVIHSGWISGYGNAVIVDHGGGVTTLYGHNEDNLVSVGQTVSQGQTIALCGSTGNSTGPHCHFEVRVNGETTSPYGYL